MSAGQLSFHKRMTALADALSCAVPPPSYFGSAAPLDAVSARRAQPTISAVYVVDEHRPLTTAAVV
ncbi:hypothetical protein ACQP2F_33160 [Actinoplanes sp. CA-030573]|uniref:hypothetical protein n=1 Tax=Actinoplanes sp. CA-030573 TaxID=3239898 RepID=UPI003D8B2980